MSERESLRILVADDDPLARRMIKVALRDAGMIVVAEACDGREAVELCLYYRPDVIDVLPRTLTAVHAGEAAISRAMTRRVIDAFRSASRGASGLRPIHGPLTAREWEVIEILAPGHSTDHVADVLVLSTETVRSHIKNIMRKLGVHSRADAVAAAEQLRNAPPQSSDL